MGNSSCLVVVLLSLSLGACGDDDCCTEKHDAMIDTGGNSDASSDAASTCLAGTYDVDATWPFSSGPYGISGTVTLPAALISGRSVQLETVQVTPSTGNHLKPQVISTQTSAITYRTRGLPDGTWKVCLRADVDGNGSVGDVGVDYVGCYDGTTSAPIKTSSSATGIVLGGACRPSADFGVGLQ